MNQVSSQFSRCNDSKWNSKWNSLSFLTMITKLQSHLGFCILHLAFCVLQDTPGTSSKNKSKVGPKYCRFRALCQLKACVWFCIFLSSSLRGIYFFKQCLFLAAGEKSGYFLFLGITSLLLVSFSGWKRKRTVDLTLYPEFSSSLVSG